MEESQDPYSISSSQERLLRDSLFVGEIQPPPPPLLTDADLSDAASILSSLEDTPPPSPLSHQLTPPEEFVAETPPEECCIMEPKRLELSQHEQQPLPCLLNRAANDVADSDDDLFVPPRCLLNRSVFDADETEWFRKEEIEVETQRETRFVLVDGFHTEEEASSNKETRFVLVGSCTG